MRLAEISHKHATHNVQIGIIKMMSKSRHNCTVFHINPPYLVMLITGWLGARRGFTLRNSSRVMCGNKTTTRLRYRTILEADTRSVNYTVNIKIARHRDAELFGLST